MKRGILKRRGRKTGIVLMALCVVLLTAIVFNVFKFYTQTRPVFGGPIYKGSKESSGIAFACNVDWGSEHLPDMLKILDAAGIRATFFVTGRWAENNEELLKLITDSGHTIGNHGYSHSDHSKLNYDQNLSEIQKTQSIIEQITGKTPKYFAPPSGAYNRDTDRAAKDLGCKMIMWSIDTIDWKRDGVDRIIERVDKKMHGGGIVLMHPTDQTLEALPTMINNIMDRGFEILPLEDIVKTIEN
ncbi:MAG: polysaccharide deacetylase family protein [Bacillota bacterium]|nr:polysaccharide deacetylase family protein [Bacillota bacterium]MDD3297285.1 polysaccharide deacetylase family protein [Bacillota bacterium]MDD3850451.1 polysaccharide deacetylase family protein [Bacillota bacterium]MDD4706801.1 polysaccharide deacetylase family protein [Bacillota bacterium]